MERAQYEIEDTKDIITPSLVYYKEIIEANMDKVIALGGGVDRLWPHVKSHKMSEVVKLLQQRGISRFKCATIAEAEMVAQCGAKDILVAYPLVGPNIHRFLELQKTYRQSDFWAIGDNYEQLSLLAEEAREVAVRTRVLIDVNIGMNRTGVPIAQAEELFERCSQIEGLEVSGLHCFSGNFKNPDFVLRKKAVEETAKAIFDTRAALLKKNYNCTVIVLSGTPILTCYSEYDNIYLSPGTAFINDYGYYSLFKDFDFIPGAAIMTRVISRTLEGQFTLDLGYKGIAADPQGQRGIILGLEHAEPLFQCEEHWTFKMKTGEEKLTPEIGQLLYVIPTHICPTTALYPYALVSEQRKIVTQWEVNARNRKITI